MNAQAGQIGAQLATPDTDQKEPGWEQFLRRDIGGTFVEGTTGLDDPTSNLPTPVWVAGMKNLGTPIFSGGRLSTDLQGGTLSGFMMAFPQVLPPGNLRRMIVACTANPPAAASGALIRMGLYNNNRGPTSLNLYPKERLFDSGSIVFESLGRKEVIVPGDGLFLSGGLYWFVVTCNAAAATATAEMCTLGEAAMMWFGGLTIRFGNGEPVYNDSLLIGWRHAQAFGTLPLTFPSSAPVRLIVQTAPDGNNIPAIFFGYSTVE